ncbi:cyclic lactone autoinducer peptide [Paenibacillus paeoniae]
MLKVAVFSVLAKVLSAAAVLIVKGPCWLFVHQEDLPDELLVKN